MASKEQIEKFEEDGYVIIEQFLSKEDVDSLRKECYDLVEEMDPAEHHTVFSTKTQRYRDDYFLKSSDKIGFFFEDGALDENGELQVEKQKALNKIGHALHVFSPNFKRVTLSAKVKDLFKSFDYKDPVCVQSMYIFKQPKIGGEVVPHQDASYLYCNKDQKVMGLWIALEDCTLDNGCLWFIPGSHLEGDVKGNYRMIRDPDRKPDEPTCIYIGEKPSYDGKYVATPVKKGDLIAIHGLVIHKSEQNTSDCSRHIYAFHVYDHSAGDWSDRNWLQPTDKGTFTHVFDC